MDDLAGLVVEFVAETRPIVDSIGDGLLALERALRADEPTEATCQRLKMDLHTVKGNAALMGLEAVETASHAMEDVLARCGGRPDAAAIELLLAGVDLIGRQIRAAASDGARDSDEARRFAARAAALLVEAGPALAGPAEPSDASARAAADSVRVSFARLDQLLDGIGEAVIAHATIGEAVARGEPAESLEPAVAALGKSLAVLQRALMEARLLPLATLFNRFGRYVRDLGRERDQPIALELDGGDTPIDKAIIDRLGEPLLHLVRNAVAHGVEPVAERQAAGKPAASTIRLAAALHSDRVHITVEDDGRGLDLAAIRRRAADLGHPVERASDDEVRRMIFQPGLSTADAVSTLAGRGVGLDVVAAAVEAMAGRIEVSSTPGAGCRFTLDLPLTLAVVRGLLAEIDGEVVVVPMTHVVECRRLSGDVLRQIEGGDVLAWRDDVIALTDGGALLGRAGAARRRPYAVVLAAGDRFRGLAVDRVLGHQDVVVKRLDGDVVQPELVSGATILGDGRVALIFDLARLLDGRFALPKVREVRHVA
jgi:two-component system, chemotaxis family, sensor kinase CheA